jgi:hypothetical protein
VRCRPCSPAASRSPRGASRGPIGWPPKRDWGPVPQRGGQQIELFEERGYANASPGLVLIRDGNGTRSFETLLRYRGAAMAEFWRVLKTLKALQAGQARDAEQACDAGRAGAHRTEAAPPTSLAARPQLPRPNEPECRAAAAPERLEFLVHDRPNEPERRSVSVPEGLEFLLPDRPAPGALHEPAAAWALIEPDGRAGAARPSGPPNEPQPPTHSTARGASGRHASPASGAAASKPLRADPCAATGRPSAPGAR